MTARGLRLNNPGNIRKSATRWQGLSDSQPDPDFCSFKTAQWGIRAMARNLLNYQSRDGCKTLRQIIGRYAPPSENNTESYVAAVLEGLKAAGAATDADAPLDVDTCEVMLPLIRAIILHENGSNPYSDATILEGIHMAGVADAPPKPLAKQNAFLAHAGACASMAGAACVAGVKNAIQDPATAAHQVKGFADSLGDYASLPMFDHAAKVLLVVAGGLTAAGIVSQILKQRTA